MFSPDDGYCRLGVIYNATLDNQDVRIGYVSTNNGVSVTNSEYLAIKHNSTTDILQLVGEAQGTGVAPQIQIQSGNDLILQPTSGNVGIGTTSPTAYLHLKAGTATAGTAPIKLTAGTNLGTPEAGAIEFDGTNLYFTDSGGTRRQLAVV